MKLKATFLILTTAIGAAISVCATPIVITDFGSIGKYSQNFDTLVNSGASSMLPAGWAFAETGTGANTTYTAGNGSVATGDTYSFGTGTSTDRALGGISSSTFNTTFGVGFQNLTGGTITTLQIGYTGEQWRTGTANVEGKLDFAYKISLNGTWVDVNSLDFTAPVVSGSGNPNGIEIGNSTLFFTINGLSIASGDTFWLSWTDFNVNGANDGLAIDNFSLTANGVKPPSVPDSLPAGFSAVTILLVLALGHRLGRQTSKA